jgi:RNA polymerase sigma-70 factor (ECF subfamily)
VKAPRNKTDGPAGVADAPAGVADAPTFEQVYSQHFPFVWRCLRALGVPDRAVDDAAQDVFLAAHRQLPAFRGESTMRTWLFAILRNVASNHRRTVHRREANDRPLRADLVLASPDPLERAQNAQAADFILGFLAGLDDKKRAVFVLGVLEEMSMPEVAAALAIPLNTAYTRLRRARDDFERALAARRGVP